MTPFEVGDKVKYVGTQYPELKNMVGYVQIPSRKEMIFGIRVCDLKALVLFEKYTNVCYWCYINDLELEKKGENKKMNKIYYGDEPIKDQTEIDMIFDLYDTHGIIHHQDMGKLKAYLTPPTIEEVCKALGEQLKSTIITRKNKHGITFNYAETKKTIVSKNYDLLNIKVQLPPHIIGLIAKYYNNKGEIK